MRRVMPAFAAFSVVAEDSSFTPCSVYLWLESQAEKTDISYCIDSSIGPDRHAAAAERVDSSSDL